MDVRIHGHEKYADFKDEGDFVKLRWNEFDKNGKEIIHRQVITPRQAAGMIKGFECMHYKVTSI
jgi:hypothetical protein